MNAGTHAIGAIATGTFYLTISSLPITTIYSPEGIVFTASALAGGLLPDICQPFSWIGRRTGILSKLIGKIFGHRTITHSILFVFFMYLVVEGIPGIYGTAIQAGLLSGIISHILLDMLTTRGVAILYPIKYNVSFPVTTKTGSIFGEGLISLLMLGWIIYYAMGLA